MAKPIVIVGAGQAAASFVSRHIRLGSAVDVYLIGEEPVPPYQRPPLSKKYLTCELEREQLFIRPPKWYAEQGIATSFGTRVESIDREADGRVSGAEIEDGEKLATDHGDLIAQVLEGADLQYDALPWFWSDQYDCKLQIAGLNTGYTNTAVRPGATDNSQSTWYYTDDRLIAVNAMNDTPAYAFGRRIIVANRHPPPSEIANPDTDLKALAD